MQFGCKWVSSLQNTVEIEMFAYSSPLCDLYIEDSEQSFMHDTQPHDNTPPYQVWLEMVEQCRRYCLDKLGHKDSRTGQMDKVIPTSFLQCDVKYSSN